MKVRILQKFHDKASYNTVYLVGETVTFDDARAEYLIGRGLAESAEDVAEAPAEDVAEALAEDAPVADVQAEEPQAEEMLVMETPDVLPAEDAPVVKPVVTRRKSTPKED